MEYDEFLDLKEKWGKSKGLIVIAVIVVLIAIAAFSSFYTVETDERAVILRLGKYVRETGPGLHFKLPFGIEKAINVKVRYVFKEEFGFRTSKSDVRTSYSSRSYQDESLMLTGDLNIAEVEWIVQYKVKNPYDVLFNVRNHRKIVRDVSEAVMRQVVGDRTITNVLTKGRGEINIEAKEKMQDILNQYESGIYVITIKLQDVTPPDPVKPAFNKVNEAKQEREKMINQSWREYNKRIPQAKGEAKKVIQEAEGYATRTINRAEGDVSRFLEIYQEYKNAKEITKKRIYIEALSEILPKAGNKYIIDPANQSILPFLKVNHKEVQK